MKRDDRGFTLIEVLVSLVVVATALTILSQGFLAGGRASATAQRVTVAAMLADSKMAECEAGIQAVNAAASGTFEPERPDYSWELQSETSTPQELLQVTITVTWEERGAKRSFALARLMKDRRNSP